MLLPCGYACLRKLSVQSVQSAFETLTVNVKKDRQKKYQPCFVLFLTVISTFSAIFSKKYFLLNVIPPFHLTPIITLIISGLYMVELGWK